MSYLLPVIQPGSVRADPLYLTTNAEVGFGPGFYEDEHDGTRQFRWMSEAGELRFEAAPVPRFLELWAASEFYDLSQRLEIVVPTTAHETRSLVRGWSPLSIEVPSGATAVHLHVNKPFPREYYPGDTRSLAIRVRDVRLHADAERHAAVRRQADNAVRNASELAAGRVVLESTPPSLGIDMHGVCNVKPPCVYCEWDYNKALEGDNETAPFTRDTLREWGPFFDNAVSLVNCSIGEPFMMKNIDELLDTFGHAGKLLEMTTNGQILTDRNIQKLVGRPILLYVSLDAATPLTYSRLRNDRFERILDNLRRLVAAKGGKGRFPHVHLVFMPMRCNVHELEAFVRLCAELQVERLVLRPLNASEGTALEWDRAGYHFDYNRELLPFDELVRVSARAARLASRLGVDLADQMDFGVRMSELFEEAFAEEDARASEASVESEVSPAGEGSAAATIATPPSDAAGIDPALLEQARSVADATPAPSPVADARTPSDPAVPPALPSLGAEHRPACTEPWTGLYILRRGVLPCCYGGRIAPMDGYREAWNGPLLQAIRTELVAGRFHSYCLESPACPLVRKLDAAHVLPWRQRALLLARRVWTRADVRLHGWPVRIWVVVRRVAHMARVLVTDPAHAVRRARIIFGSNRTV